MKTLSIVIPFFNEGENIRRMSEEVHQLKLDLDGKYNLEVIYVDNHSNDNSYFISQQIVEKFPYSKVIRLSRNFGYQASILTGYMNCLGDAVVELDSDGEDDPQVIKKFLEKWSEGYEVVYGIRKSRNEKWYITLQRKFFYRIINKMAKIPLPLDAGDFRLIDRKIIDELGNFKENTLYLRGIVSYIGFNQTGIPYSRRPRYDGRSKFGWFGALQFAWHAIASFSSRPLLYVAYMGVLFSILSSIIGFLYLILALNEYVDLSNTVILAVLLFFLTGIQLFGIGLLGAYLGRIFEEVKGRPRSVIQEVFTLKKS